MIHKFFIITVNENKELVGTPLVLSRFFPDTQKVDCQAYRFLQKVRHRCRLTVVPVTSIFLIKFWSSR